MVFEKNIFVKKKMRFVSETTFVICGARMATSQKLVGRITYSPEMRLVTVVFRNVWGVGEVPGVEYGPFVATMV